MSTITAINKLGTTLFGKTRRAVLALLYGHPNESFYLRQLARMTGVGMGSLQRELKQLSEAGIIIRNEIGKNKFTLPNPVMANFQGGVIKMSEFCPRCSAIRNIVMTSSGRVIIDPDGRKKIIRTHHFHCETCNSFVRSEDIDKISKLSKT